MDINEMVKKCKYICDYYTTYEEPLCTRNGEDCPFNNKHYRCFCEIANLYIEVFNDGVDIIKNWDK